MTTFNEIKQKLTQNRKTLLPVAIAAILAGLLLIWFGSVGRFQGALLAFGIGFLSSLLGSRP